MTKELVQAKCGSCGEVFIRDEDRPGVYRFREECRACEAKRPKPPSEISYTTRIVYDDPWKRGISMDFTP